MKKGNVFIIIGLVFLAAALCIVLFNSAENRRAERASQSVLEKLEIPEPESAGESETASPGKPAQAAKIPDYELNPDMEPPIEIIDGCAYIGKLTIPELSLELPVCSEWDYEKLKTSPCRYSGTPYRNDLVICAHNFDDHFGNIKNLGYGDEIRFTDIDGNVFRYTVGSIETLQPESIEEMKESEWDLTLFTCTLGGATRVTVRCKAED